MLIELKKGNKIYIKPKNRGKFTKYCNGKVTDECIRKAKASGNPTLVKRATFADNARHWKHLLGGIMKAGFGDKFIDFVQNDLGFNKSNYKHIISDLLEFGILPDSLEGNVNYGVVAPGILNRGSVKTPLKKIMLPNNLLYIERVEDKAARMLGEKRKAFKRAEAWADNDLRHSNSGLSKFKNRRRESLIEMINKYPSAARLWNKYQLRRAKITDLEALKRVRQEENDFLENFAKTYGYKQGGIIKAEDGTKTTWWKKAGEWLNSDTGKGITNLVFSGINKYNKSKLQALFSNEFDLATNLLANAMGIKNWNLLYLKRLLLAPYYFLQNPDSHYSIVDYQNFAKQYADSNIDPDSIALFRADRAKLKMEQINAIQGKSSTASILESGLGLLSSYLG